MEVDLIACFETGQVLLRFSIYEEAVIKNVTHIHGLHAFPLICQLGFKSPGRNGLAITLSTPFLNGEPIIAGTQTSLNLHGIIVGPLAQYNRLVEHLLLWLVCGI